MIQPMEIRKVAVAEALAEQFHFNWGEFGIKRLDVEFGDLSAVISVLEMNPGDAEALVRAQTIAERSAGDPEEVQAACDAIFVDRFKQATIPHHRPIEKLKPLAPEKIVLTEVRSKNTERFGFRFRSFNNLLTNLGFWTKIGPLLEQIPLADGGVTPGQIDWKNVNFEPTNENFLVFLNAINGSARINYESAYPELADKFDALKMAKYHLSLEQVAEKRRAGSVPLSVPDILTVVALDRLDQNLSPELRVEAARLQSEIINDSVSNTDRIQNYRRLHKVYTYNVPADSDLAEILQAAAMDLRLPEGHPGRCDNLTDLRSVDVAIPLFHTDDGIDAYLVRAVIERFPEAFVAPVGGQAPHQIQESKVQAQRTEADETIAALLALEYKFRFAEYPDLTPIPEYPPVSPSDILPPDQLSNDTAGNAGNLVDRLSALKEVLDRPLAVVIVTSHMHSSRAYAEFLQQLPPDLVESIRVWDYQTAPPLSNIGTSRKIMGIMTVLSEYVKRVYMVGTVKG